MRLLRRSLVRLSLEGWLQLHWHSSWGGSFHFYRTSYSILYIRARCRWTCNILAYYQIFETLQYIVSDWPCFSHYCFILYSDVVLECTLIFWYLSFAKIPIRCPGHRARDSWHESPFPALLLRNLGAERPVACGPLGLVLHAALAALPRAKFGLILS